MIELATGNLLTADVDALVNTVNTVGVMGKGIALQFKNAYPAMFAEYQRAAKAGDIQLGRMHVWETHSLSGPRFIINFPTKGHWRSASNIDDIDSGLRDLVATVHDLGITSIAIPPLGAGNGGLMWTDVEPRIRAAFAEAGDVKVAIYAPTFRPRASEMQHAGPKPSMTRGRAALIEIMDAYQRYALEATPLEVQKLMYFLQEAGEPLRLKYVAGRYGPYADNLRHVLKQVEGYYVTGYGDGSARVMDAEPLGVLKEALPQARAMLQSSPVTNVRVDRVIKLTADFASMYGLELLATVHWCAAKLKFDDDGVDLDRIVTAVHAWSPRKRDMFTSTHITVACQALNDKGWLASASS